MSDGYTLNGDLWDVQVILLDREKDTEIFLDVDFFLNKLSVIDPSRPFHDLCFNDFGLQHILFFLDTDIFIKFQWVFLPISPYDCL